jgi:hypothetical protein
MENEDMIVRVNGNTGNLPKNHPFGENRPAVNDDIRIARILLSRCTTSPKR